MVLKQGLAGMIEGLFMLFLARRGAPAVSALSGRAVADGPKREDHLWV